MLKYVNIFKVLQKTLKIRVADFCRERILDYYEIAKTLKKDKFFSKMSNEHTNATELKIMDLPFDSLDPNTASFIQEVSIYNIRLLNLRRAFSCHHSERSNNSIRTTNEDKGYHSIAFLSAFSR